MPINDHKLNQSVQQSEAKQSETKQVAAEPIRPNYSSVRAQQQANDLHSQSADGIGGLVLAVGQQEAHSLQRLDATLSRFEETMSDRLADRISQVGTRVAALTLQKLQQRQPSAPPPDICVDAETLLMRLDLPELALPAFNASAPPHYLVTRGTDA